MKLSDSAIIRARVNGEIVIEPFNIDQLHGNSYDVLLSPYLATYRLNAGKAGLGGVVIPALDCRSKPEVDEHVIDPDHGFLMMPGILYLGSTVEYTETNVYLPYIDGRSSAARLGISVHETAGRGDVGFEGHWTLEMTVVHPTWVYANVTIAQITYDTVDGEVLVPYNKRPGANYNNRDPKPKPSAFYKSFIKG